MSTRPQQQRVEAESEDPLPYIPHAKFTAGVAYGHYRIVINPALARPFVVQRTRVNVLAATLICVGAALALSGMSVPGAVVVALGIAANRIVKHQAGKIVLHLAQNDAAVYEQVTRNGVMEVRRAD